LVDAGRAGNASERVFEDRWLAGARRKNERTLRGVVPVYFNSAAWKACQSSSALSSQAELVTEPSSL
jgi:hypothetical protein